jgi:molecular chaperone IbpA
LPLDRPFDALESGFLAEAKDGYRPFDIVNTGENSYGMTRAVASFTPDEIDITAQQNQLVISGSKPETGKEGVEFIHRGSPLRAPLPAC